MVCITNDVEQFFDENNKVVIFGAGKIGYWFAQMMNRSNSQFDVFIDNRIDLSGAICQEHSIMSLAYVENELKTKDIGMIIATERYSEVFVDLFNRFNNYSNRLCLLIPVWSDSSGVNRYMINRAFGVLRRRILGWDRKDVPTIISNDCIAGRLYECLGIYGDICESPTVNVFITHDDFIKMCLKPRHYLQRELSDELTTITFIDGFTPYPTGRIDDVKIQFVHTKRSFNELSERWNNRIKHIKWDRIVFVIREGDPISIDQCQRISSCRYPYTVFKRNDDLPRSVFGSSFFGDGGDKHYVFLPRIVEIFDKNEPVENCFDLIGWFNSCFE